MCDYVKEEWKSSVLPAAEDMSSSDDSNADSL